MGGVKATSRNHKTKTRAFPDCSGPRYARDEGWEAKTLLTLFGLCVLTLVAGAIVAVARSGSLGFQGEFCGQVDIPPRSGLAITSMTTRGTLGDDAKPGST